MNILPKHDHYKQEFNGWAAAFWFVQVAILIIVIIGICKIYDLTDKQDRTREYQQRLLDKFDVETNWKLRSGKLEID